MDKVKESEPLTADCSTKLLTDARDEGNNSAHKQLNFAPGIQHASDKLVASSVLPSVDLTGFDQPATDKSSGAGSLWSKAKGLFAHSETLGDQVHDKVVKSLKPDERKAFDNETEQMSKYDKAYSAWASSMIVPPPARPEAPKTPEHDEVKKRTDEAEQKIDADVRSHMSKEDRERLDKQMNEYKQAMDKATKIVNPFGTGEGRDPKPEPGNAIKDYWDRVRESTEAYIQR